MASAQMTPALLARRRKMQYLSQTAPPVLPCQCKWTKDKDDEMTAVYLFGLPIKSIADRFVYGLTTTQAQNWVCDRLKLLKLCAEIPKDRQRSYQKCPKSDYYGRLHARGKHRATAMVRQWKISYQRSNIGRRKPQCDWHVQTCGLVVWTT
jgi:hypothetical protein